MRADRSLRSKPLPPPVSRGWHRILRGGTLGDLVEGLAVEHVRGTGLESAARKALSVCQNWHFCGPIPPSSQLRIRSKLEVSHSPGLFPENFTVGCSQPLLRSRPFSAHSSCLTGFQRLSPKRKRGHVPACGSRASKPPTHSLQSTAQQHGSCHPTFLLRGLSLGVGCPLVQSGALGSLGATRHFCRLSHPNCISPCGCSLSPSQIWWPPPSPSSKGTTPTSANIAMWAPFLDQLPLFSIL